MNADERRKKKRRNKKGQKKKEERRKKKGERRKQKEERRQATEERGREISIFDAAGCARHPWYTRPHASRRGARSAFTQVGVDGRRVAVAVAGLV